MKMSLRDLVIEGTNYTKLCRPAPGRTGCLSALICSLLAWQCSGLFITAVETPRCPDFQAALIIPLQKKRVRVMNEFTVGLGDNLIKFMAWKFLYLPKGFQ